MSEGITNVYIVFWYLVVLGGIRCWAELHFIAKVNGKALKSAPSLLYIAISRIPAAICFWLQTPYLGNLLILGMLLLFSAKVLRLPLGRASLSCTIVFVLGTFFEGYLEIIMSPLSSMLRISNVVAQLAIQTFVSALLLGVLLASYSFIVRRYPLHTGVASSPTTVTVLPCALIIWAVRLSMAPDTGNRAVIDPQNQKYFALFIWLGVSALAFFFVLATNHKAGQLVAAYQENRLLEKESRIQSQSTKEAMRRWEDTRAYQHDIRNHILVVSGLLKQDKQADALAYLDKLVLSSNELVPVVSTGSAALDILLEEKIQYAHHEGIAVHMDFQTQFENGMDELDLCVLFANGLDNAIHASAMLADTEKDIQVFVKKRNNFVLIRIVNRTIAVPSPVPYGTGLHNIQKIAQKYNGSIQTKQTGNLFYLSVLLCGRYTSEP